MKNKILYLRNERVGSSKFIGSVLKPLGLTREEEGIVQYNHSDYHTVKGKLLERFSEKEWRGIKKIVSIRNPWGQHLSRFFRREGTTITNMEGYKKTPNTHACNAVSRELPLQTSKIKNKIKNLFQQEVKRQHSFYKNKRWNDKYNKMTIEETILSNEPIPRMAFTKCAICWGLYTFKNETDIDLFIRIDSPDLLLDLRAFLILVNLEHDEKANKLIEKYAQNSKNIFSREGPERYRYFYDKETMQKVGEMRSMEINAHDYKF